MKLKALSLALAQTLLPTFSKEQTQTKRGNPTKSQTSTISKKERKRRTKHKKVTKKQKAKGKK
ncbi:hypothetical protein [Helicobacter rodentium]|uniref:hypothetical protein n=1 Tax=Helicobacter rodentium TaxID=59617 RepID=UPI0012EBABAB|nr:hypothetical protein [Helicobacter rodentium]